MKNACAYAIVQFRPDVETGEFANVGLVLLCADKAYLGFKLLKRRTRVIRFFEELDPAILRQALTDFEMELQRVAEWVVVNPGPTGMGLQHAFADLVRPREGVLRFSEPRLALAEDPVQKLNELFDHAIARDFATPEYQSRLLERGVQATLRQGHVSFKAAKVGNDDFSVPFPMVLWGPGGAMGAIKPLYLAQSEPTDILTRGGAWVDRIKRLKKHGTLPGHTLMAIKPPEQSAQRQLRACREIDAELQELGVKVVDAGNQSQILAFARGVLPQ